MELTFILPDRGKQGVLKHVGAIQEEKDTSDHDLSNKKQKRLHMTHALLKDHCPIKQNMNAVLNVPI